ncbi:MAG TPA: LuxR C-terminal-related transcriptional regulator, partial [Chitinophagaceae bacterium]|nr:LuxR C-terminal-related transcriptional regulator [Chitinophagaceae bacterium]
YDILMQMQVKIGENNGNVTDRVRLFSEFLLELKNKKQTTIIVFEDIHWADEATLDFIKFFARRITQIHCLFILTYRDNEIHSNHPLRNVLGQLPPDSFTRLQLTSLSREAVEKLAQEKGWSGGDVYSISGGNPFYVTEILASYSPGIPDNIKDSILSVYNRMDEKAKHIWQILSVFPTAFEIKYLEKMEPSYATAIENYLDLKILILDKGFIFFKHELYRKTIESSLSPLVRIALNKKILELFRKSFEANHEIERIIHHAKNANEYEMVVHYAPLAAKQAEGLGAHIEAARLYLTAIEYYQGDDKNILIQFYESYAYECYLTNQVKEAIIYAGKSLAIWQGKNDPEKAGNCMRFLSRLWWLDGNRKKAENFGEQAIEVLSSQPSSPVKAMAFSNMSQLKMLFDQSAECIAWGEKAIVIARELGDEETLSHALNNVGSVRMIIQSSKQKGIELLQQSLEIALKNSYHDHSGRAYTNLGSIAVRMKDWGFAKKILDEGIQYCEERDLDSWRSTMLSMKARLNLETGNWTEAYSIADNLLKNENQPTAVTINALAVVASIKMRTGDTDVLPLLLEAETKAFETMEMQRIIPSLVALLEYEWLTGKIFITKEDLDRTTGMIGQSINYIENNEFAFWLLKARKLHFPLGEMYEGYDVSSVIRVRKAAAFWGKLGCPYEQALVLFEGTDDDKRKAIKIVHELGANTVYEKMKFEMRALGIKSIPRGIRKTTSSNPANLTERELDVLQLLKEGLQNKEIGAKLFISPKTVDHHISSIFFKLDVNTRAKAVQEAIHLAIIK